MFGPITADSTLLSFVGQCTRFTQEKKTRSRVDKKYTSIAFVARVSSADTH